MDERSACALLKRRFEAAGYRVEENRAFDEDGVRFEIDGFDPEARVGYEYVTREAGDDWDVDGDVIAALAARRAKGELFILVVDEQDAPDEASLDARATEFLDELPASEPAAAAKKPAARKPAAKKPAARKKPTAKKK
jgi:hypothetical protein